MMTTKLLTSFNTQLWKSSLRAWNQPLVRNLSVTRILEQQQTTTKERRAPLDAAELVMTAKWRTIFKFPYMKHVVSINKVKMFHTAFTLFIVPASLAIPEYLNTMTG